MATLIAAAAAFVGSHLLLSHPWRAPLVAWAGRGGFMALYTLVAFATLGWMVWAFRAVGPQPGLWLPGDGIWIVASAIMLAASILFAGSLIGNPAMPAPGAVVLATRQPAGVFGITRHPMMWGFALWAVAHVLVAPDPATLVLCGAVALLALAGSLGQDRKKARLMGTPWLGWRARTAFVPFARQVVGKDEWSTAWPGFGAVVAGTMFWLAATWAHVPLGAPAAGLWRWIG